MSEPGGEHADKALRYRSALTRWRERMARGEPTGENSAQDLETPAGYMRASVDDSDQTDLDDEERAMIECLRKAKFDTWFEFCPEDGGPSPASTRDGKPGTGASDADAGPNLAEI